MAGEQSSGTFVAVPGETPGAQGARGRTRRAPRGSSGEAAAPLAARRRRPRGGRSLARGRVTLSWPLDNLGPSLPNLLATVAGNLFELQAFSGLRLLDLRLPAAFAAANPGPRFGIAGTRGLCGRRGPAADRHHRQALGRPSPEETAALVRTLCGGGHRLRQGRRAAGRRAACPFDDRVRAVMRGGEPPSPTGPGGAGHVRLQPDGRDRRDAPPARPRAGRGRHLRDGQPQRGRADGDAGAGAAHASCRSTPTATAGARCRGTRCSAVAYVAWSKLWRLAGRGPHACQRARQQVLRERRQRHRLGARRCSDAAVRGRRRCVVDAGLLLGPDGAAGGRHLAALRIRRPDLRRRRRHHGPSRRAARPAWRRCARPGRRRMAGDPGRARMPRREPALAAALGAFPA